jgi:hypothetical protein
MSVFVEEMLQLESSGFMVNTRNNGKQRIRVCLLGVAGDYRWLPGVLGSKRDPAKHGACIGCTITGVRNPYSNRTTYKMPHNASIAPKTTDHWSVVDADFKPTSELYHCVPALAALQHFDPCRQWMYCYIHGISTVLDDIMKMLED